MKHVAGQFGAVANPVIRPEKTLSGVQRLPAVHGGRESFATKQQKNSFPRGASPAPEPAAAGMQIAPCQTYVRYCDESSRLRTRAGMPLSGFIMSIQAISMCAVGKQTSPAIPPAIDSSYTYFGVFRRSTAA